LPDVFMVFNSWYLIYFIYIMAFTINNMN